MNEKKFNILKHAAIIVTISFIFLFIFKELAYLPKSWNLVVLFYIALGIDTIFLSQKIKRIPENERSKDIVVIYITHIFILTLILIIFNQFFEKELIKNILAYIIGFSISSGFLVLYSYQDKLEKNIEKEKKDEKKDEEKRKKEFPQKFPQLNRIPILREFAKFIYKEGWIYALGIILIMVLAFGIYSSNLGEFNLENDEFLAFDAATGYHFEKEFYPWDWADNQSTKESCDPGYGCPYDRAWPHTWLIAQSFDLFGVSEWAGRIVSVVFGVLMIGLGYLISKKIFGLKKISLIFSALILLSSSYYGVFRYIRMYALLVPIFFLIWYLIGKGLSTNKRFKIFGKEIEFVHAGYLLAGLVLLGLAFLLHVNSLIIGPITLVFLIFLVIKYREKKHLTILLSIITLAFIILFLKIISPELGYALSNVNPLSNATNIYWKTLFSYPLGFSIGLILVAVFSIKHFLLNSKNKMASFVVLSVLVSGVFFVYLTARYYTFFYISHITTISLLLIIYAAYTFTKLLEGKWHKIICIILLLLVFVPAIYQLNTAIHDERSNYAELYNVNSDFGEFPTAYRTIIDNYQEGEVIFGQYLRTYYLKDLPGDTNIVGMRNNKLYTFEKFIEDLERYDSGWITWETVKKFHLRKEIMIYVCENFDHLTGSQCGDKMDSYGVEIFYFNKSI